MSTRQRALQIIVFAVLTMVMATGFVYAAVIANSVADFSDTQGKGNWSYGEWYNPATGATIDDYNYKLYQDLPYYNPNTTWKFSAWMRSAEGAGWYPFISSEQTQPRIANEWIGPTNGWSVRRWTSNYTGTVNISGLVWRLDGTGGNGMHIIIMKNAATSTTNDTLYNVFYASDDNTEHSYSITVPVAVNDKIDFIVEPIGDHNYDRIKYTAVINTIEQKDSTLPRVAEMVYAPSVTDFFGTVRFYPALGGELADKSPVARIRDAKSGEFGVDVRIGWREDAIKFVFDVQDPKPGDTVAGLGMWTGDSIQLGIDTQPDKTKNRFYELGFALTSSGEVIHCTWQSGSKEFDWNMVKAGGKRTVNGYQITVSIPWKSLDINPNSLPEKLGINVLLNDVDASSQRRFVEWTPGLGITKDPSQFKQVMLVDGKGTRSVACLTVDSPLYKQDKTIIAGQYEEYALVNLPSMKLDVVVHGAGKTFEVGTAILPEVTAGEVRQVKFGFPEEALSEGEYRLSAKTANAPSQELAWASFQRMNLGTRLKEEQEHLTRVQSLILANPQLSGDDYIRLGITTAERFIRRVGTGGPDGKQPLNWSSLQINEIKEVLEQTEVRIKRAVANKISPQLVPQPTGGPVTVHDGIFYTDTTIGKDSPAIQRPFYFNGYGVFTQVAADIPNFRNFGVTLVSQERGPISMNPDGSLNEQGRSILGTLKSAAENGIKVDLLLSPHYFPQWAVAQSPDVLPTEYAGFPNFHIDHPKAREVIQKWLETIVSAVKDEPALFSLCLANEANNQYGGRDPWSRPRWIEYLKQQHRTIESLNALYGTNYKKFEDVLVPGIQMPEQVDAQRAYYDWVRFNQYHFADWFRWMNDIVKRLAPEVPTHIKVAWTFFFHRTLHLGNDLELMCEITDLAGNDCAALPGSGGYDLKGQGLWYDLLHSFSGQPVFNSENHLILDGAPAVSFPSNHIRSVLWQGALHHQGATTLWVWEEPGDPQVVPQLEGSIYLRPTNIYTAGQTMLDLNRLAPEVTAINQDKPKVALLYSMPSWVWQEDYVEVMKKVYTSLLHMGQPVTFVSERQLASNRAAKVDWIIIPNATHVQDATVAALKKFMEEGGRVVMAGKDCLRWDEYQRPRKPSQGLGTVAQIDSTTNEQQFTAFLRQVLVDGGLKLTGLQNVADGKPVWGVEYRTVPYRGGVLAPMINFLPQSQNVRLPLSRKDKSELVTDLMSGEAVNLEDIRLDPQQPRLLWVP